MATKLSLEVNETVWLDPKSLEFNISPSHDLSGRVGGDWDLTRRYPLERSAKHRAIVERYIEGKRWEETDLFLDVYARRFEKGDNVRDAGSFKGLVKQYYTRVDGMFESMKKNGFLTKDGLGRDVPLPGILVGRGGEMFLDNQGNHRVAMAKVIGLEKIAGRIKCVHKSAKDCLAFLP